MLSTIQAMIFLLLGVSLLVAIFTAVYLGMRNSYTATEGLLALVLLQSLFLGIIFTVYGIYLLLR